MFKKYNFIFISTFSLLDVALTLAAVYLANSRFPMLLEIKPVGERAYIQGYFYLAVAMVWAVVFRVFPMYNSKRATPILRDVVEVCIAAITSWIILVSGVFFFSFTLISRFFLVYFGILDIVFLIAFHIFLRIILRIIRKQGYNTKSVLIIGAGAVGQMVARELHSRPWTGFSVIGYLDDNPNLIGKIVLSHPVLGSLDDAPKFVEKMHHEDEVIFALPSRSQERLVELINILEDIPINIRIVPDFFTVSLIRPTIDDLWGIPLIGIRKPYIPLSSAILKRVMDIIGSMIGIVIFSPIMVVVAILIKIDSDGPVFFTQERAGENLKPFTIYKFRTMVKDAQAKLEKLINLDTLEEPVFKIKQDPRVTRIGRFLRRTSLDELPQLFNVLKGDMSLVGPRPEETGLVLLYNGQQRVRLMVKPGMTGPAQVKGRADLSLKDRVMLEEEYIRDYSIWKDVEILFQTIPAVIRGNGSY